MKNYGAVTTVEGLKALAAQLQKAVDEGRPIGFDIETGYHGPDKEEGSLKPEYGFVVGFSITDSTDWARYVPLRHDMANNIDPDIAWDIMRPIFENGKLIAHNAKFEKRFMRREGIELNIYSDSMIEAFMLSEWESIALKNLTKKVFDHDQAEITTLFPDLTAKQLKCLRFNVLDVDEKVTAYACEDALWCLALHERHYDRVKDMMLFKIELEVMGILCDMEEDGVLVDFDLLREKGQEIQGFMSKQQVEIIADLSALVGRPLAININSSDQLGKILYGELGMPNTRKTKGGKDSTDAVAMAGLAKQFPVVKKILEWREAQALFKRYLDKYPKEYDTKDHRVHPNIKQCVVGTGRLAIDKPSLQQLPGESHWVLNSGTEFNCVFRNALMARDGYYLLDFDYSQVELRVMAGISQEMGLVEAFNRGDDPHAITASNMLGIPLDQVTKEQRGIGKTMNFALLYGMGVGSLADRLAVTRERASELYAAFFAAYPNITTWMDKMKREGKDRGFTISKFGRKYTIWELQSSNKAIYSKGERVCVNAPIQGGAADYMKVATVRMARVLKKLGLYRNGVHIILDNHDAKTYEVREDIDPFWLRDQLIPAVEYPVDGFPKIEAEWSIGPRWGSMKSLEVVNDFTDLPPQESSNFINNDSFTAEDVSNNVDAVSNGAMDSIEHSGTPIIIELSEMPSADEWARFSQLASATPGPNLTTVRTPEGDIALNTPTSLDLTYQPRISTIFSTGAALYNPPEAIDASEMIAGITL